MDYDEFRLKVFFEQSVIIGSPDDFCWLLRQEYLKLQEEVKRLEKIVTSKEQEN